MKTGGTSLRRMLVDAVGADRVYPNDEDLAARRHGWYPGPQEFVDILRSDGTHEADIFIGHFPFVLREEFESQPVTVALIREPVARTVSMLKHRKLKSRQPDLDYEQLLDRRDFVHRQICDYQTKIFAFDSIKECPETVDIAFDLDERRFERALNRLGTVDILGLTEDLEGFCARFKGTTGIALNPRHDNISSRENDPAPREAHRIDMWTRYDQMLYEAAISLIG